MIETTKELNINEKIDLVSGTDYMYTNSIDGKVEKVSMSDGPCGVRKQTEEREVGIYESAPATAFPTPGTVANSWSRINLSRMGGAIGDECRGLGVNLLLGPGLNVKRNPLCGRNFEYFSEDPYLAGECGLNYSCGVQSKNVGVTLKHFALNNSENYRSVSNSICDERTMREIYLKPFEKIIKNAKPHAVMCAYNKVNGIHCSENEQLINGILRDEWGFDGVVMTDWGAMHDRVKSLKAGVDLEMPGESKICKRQVALAIKNGSLSEATLDKSAQRVIELSRKYEDSAEQKIDFDAHHELAGVLAQESAVLMKNDGTLPLKGDEKLCVVGELFSKMRYQGAGSSFINATRITTVENAFDANNIKYEYARGYELSSDKINTALIAEAVEKAEKADVILLFAGLSEEMEYEGCDRESMKLSDAQLALIDKIIALNKKVVCVLFGGSVVELPFADKTNAILNMFLPGQNGGTATFNLLFGKANPCGRLAQSWMEKYEDVPFYDEYSNSDVEVYKEGLFVGYRYYVTAGVKPAFPFGYGLSYTTFDYENRAQLRINGNRINVSCNIVNSGSVKGKETVQLYVSKNSSDVVRPKRELKGFRQVNLNPGENRRVEISLNKDDLAVYGVKRKKWVVESGKYTFEICSSSQDVKASISIEIEGEKIEKEYEDEIFSVYSKADLEKVTDEFYENLSGRKIERKNKTDKLTLDSRFVEFKSTFFGRIIYKAVTKHLEKGEKNIMAMEDGEEKNRAITGIKFRRISVDNSSVMQMTMAQPNVLPYNCALALVDLANGNVFGALFNFMKKIKVPSLSKNKAVK
ncbi:MAG: glycoside hydrolase family 3 C-terminal domain-containing protein [Clostridia bacterium]|nr:glycoside hydrolase family 3 C-terminal domain-containing protein [Clostridia bacterium]